MNIAVKNHVHPRFSSLVVPPRVSEAKETNKKKSKKRGKDSETATKRGLEREGGREDRKSKGEDKVSRTCIP